MALVCGQRVHLVSRLSPRLGNTSTSLPPKVDHQPRVEGSRTKDTRGDQPARIRGLGVNEQTAYDIAWRLASDVSLETIGTDVVANSTEATVLGLHLPRRIGRSWVVPFAAEQSFGTAIKSGRPSPPRLPYVEVDPLPLSRWLAYLAQPREALPSWLRGSLRVRVYLDREAARADGFSQQTLRPDNYSHAVFPVIFEQGRVQLWVTVPFSDDPTVMLADETYGILDEAGFITDDLRARDSQSALRRMVRAATTGHKRPDRLDLSPAGLKYEPGRRE